MEVWSPGSPCSKLGIHVALSLLLLVLTGPADGAPSGATQRTVGGLALSGGGALMIPVTHAYDVSQHDSAGKAFLGSTSVIMLTTGFPSLIVGLVEFGHRGSLRGDDRARDAWGQMAAGVVLGPTFMIVGGVAGTYGLVAAVTLCADGTHRTPTSLPLITTGLALFGTSFPMMVDGDVGISVTNAGGNRTRLKPNSILSAAMFLNVVFAVVEFPTAIALAIREAPVEDQGLQIMFGGMVAHGLTSVGAAIGLGYAMNNRWKRVENEIPEGTQARRIRTAAGVQVCGLSPFFEPVSRTTGVQLLGRW